MNIFEHMDAIAAAKSASEGRVNPWGLSLSPQALSSDKVPSFLFMRGTWVLALLGIIASIGYFVFIAAHSGQEQDLKHINRVGGQRMLVRQVELHLSQLATVRDAQKRREVLAAIARSIDALDARHQEMVGNGKPSRSSRKLSAESLPQGLRELYFGPRGALDSDMRMFISQTRDFLLLEEQGILVTDAAEKILSDTIAENLIASLSSVVQKLETKSKQDLRLLAEIALGGLVFFLGALFLAEIGISRPLNRKIQQGIVLRDLAIKSLDGIMTVAAEAVITIDTKGDILAVNPAAVNMFGYALKEMIGRNIRDLMPEPNKSKHDGYMANYLRTGEAKIIGKLARRQEFAQRKDGSIFPIDLSINRIDHAGQIFFTGLIRDVSNRVLLEKITRQTHEDLERQINERTGDLRAQIVERQYIEDSLRESEHRFRSIAETAPIGIMIAQVGTDRILYCNDRLATLVGAGDAAEVLGRRTIGFYADPRDQRLLIEEIQEQGRVRNREIKISRVDGTPRWLLISVEPITFESKSALLTVAMDITREHDSRARMIHVSKLASLGEMATGVAHELNQPLNIIRMAAESGLERLTEGDGPPPVDFLRAKLERIAGQTERAAAIIDHMRIFGRESKEQAEPIDVRSSVQGAMGLIGEQLRLRNIKLDIDMPEECGKILGHTVQVEQVILNLISNASDAIEAKAAADHKTEKRIAVQVENDAPCGQVRLIIRDSGGGIPESLLSRIFEPFFTTKDVGKGTGLGLSISYGIIADMGGDINAVNTPMGAEFTIAWPIWIEN